MKIFGFSLERLFVMLLAIVIVLAMGGCSGFQIASGVHTAIADGVSLAQNELPGLEAVGVVSASEVPAVSGYVALTQGLNGQFESCITNANQTALKTNAKFVACLNIFAVGLTDPKELASLRVLNPKAQARLQLWSGFFVGSINFAITQLGGMTNPVPVISSAPATSAELLDFAQRAGVAYGR